MGFGACLLFKLGRSAILFPLDSYGVTGILYQLVHSYAMTSIFGHFPQHYALGP